MKFTWGTGVLSFLILFLLAMAALLIFAFRQDVNLVHEDYYEKGVDHNEQMEAEQRGFPYRDLIRTESGADFFVIGIEEELAARIDSGKVVLFRPSDSQYDFKQAWFPGSKELRIGRAELIRGRYILQLSWYEASLRHALDFPVEVK